MAGLVFGTILSPIARRFPMSPSLRLLRNRPSSFSDIRLRFFAAPGLSLDLGETEIGLDP